MHERYPPACLATTVSRRASLALSLTAAGANKRRAARRDTKKSIAGGGRMRNGASASTKPELDP